WPAALPTTTSDLQAVFAREFEVAFGVTRHPLRFPLRVWPARSNANGRQAKTAGKTGARRGSAPVESTTTEGFRTGALLHARCKRVRLNCRRPSVPQKSA